MNILTPRTFLSDAIKRFLKNMTGRDKIGLGREIFEASRPRDVNNLKPMANPVKDALRCYLFIYFFLRIN